MLIYSYLVHQIQFELQIFKVSYLVAVNNNGLIIKIMILKTMTNAYRYGKHHMNLIQGNLSDLVD